MSKYFFTNHARERLQTFNITTKEAVKLIRSGYQLDTPPFFISQKKKQELSKGIIEYISNGPVIFVIKPDGYKKYIVITVYDQRLNLNEQQYNKFEKREVIQPPIDKNTLDWLKLKKSVFKYHQKHGQLEVH